MGKRATLAMTFSTLAGWLRYRAGVILALVLPCLFFLLLTVLYGEGFSMAWYGTLVCAVLGLIFSVFDFLRFRERRGRLQQALEGLNIVTEYLPAPSNALEDAYQEIIAGMYREHSASLLKARQRESDMADYYTLWAHQIKTPISALKLLLQGSGAGEKRCAMEQELFRIEQYAQMVLHYLRLESMASDLIIKSYDLYDIVGQAVKKYSASFIGRRLFLDFEEFEFGMLTDEKWLTVVIEQLLSNCIKYTVEGGITIRMEPEDLGNMRAEGAPNGESVLLIRDTGIGIQEEDLPRIFEKGFTGYNGRMDKKSTGIGMYLVKQILDRLSLKITVRSAPGKGTEYRIWIPEDCRTAGTKNGRQTEE